MKFTYSASTFGSGHEVAQRSNMRFAPKVFFLARRAQETEQRRALFNAETDAETTKRLKSGFKIIS
jgi:hypothetical protein